MEIPQVVIDTNVLVAALRSRRGASHRLLSLIDGDLFQIHLSVPLVLEYEDVLSRSDFAFSPLEIRQFIDYLCAVAGLHEVYYLWRPQLADQKDDMLLELAVAASCDYIVTFNARDFRGIDSFGVQALQPHKLLKMIGDIP